MQKKDAELRGKKPSTRNEEPEPKKASKSEKQRPEEKNEAAEKEKKSEIEPKGEAIKDTKDIDEDEGDYSNIDKVFEEKLKSNQLQFDEGEEDDLLPEELLQKELGKRSVNKTPYESTFLANQGNEDEAPVWEDFSVDEIKRSADKMEGLFLDTGSRQSPGMYGNDNVKNGSFQNINSRNQGFGETFDDNSTNASNMTPKSGGGGWDPYLSPQQQQQQFMKQNASNYDFQYMNQGLPVNNPNKMAGGVVNKPMMNNPNYYPMPQQMSMNVNPQMYQQMPMKPTPTVNTQSIGLSKQIPPTNQSKVFGFFCRDDYDKKQWFYKDLQHKVQGPFSAREMDDWFESKLLPLTLLITYGESNEFKTLADLVRYVEMNSAKPMQQKPQPQPTMTKQPTSINFATISYAQMMELLKNPDFIQYAQATGLNLHQIVASIKEREQYYAMNNQQGYTSPMSNNFESQGYYQTGGDQMYYGKTVQQPVNKGGFGPTQVISLQNQVGPDYNYKGQGMYQNFNNPDYNKMNSGYSNPNNATFKAPTNKAYPTQYQQPQMQQTTQHVYMQQQQQPQYVPQEYSTNVNLNSAIPQNKTPKAQQTPNVIQAESPDLMTNQLKSLLGLGGGNLGNLIGGSDFQKNDEVQGSRFQASDFPSFSESYK